MSLLSQLRKRVHKLPTPISQLIGGRERGRLRTPLTNKVRDCILHTLVPKDTPVFVGSISVYMYLYSCKDIISRKLYVYNIWEEGVTHLLKRIVRSGSIVVDVGAHIGYHTLHMAKLSVGKVFAFEPCPLNFALLRRNVNLNNFSNVVLEKKAVSNVNGEAKLFLSSKNMGWQTIAREETFTKEQQVIKVAAVSLDSYLAAVDSEIDLVKIDVEGSEPFVIEGMKSILCKDRPRIIMEVSPLLWRRIGYDAKSVLDNLSNLGYECRWIDHLGNTHSSNVDKVSSILSDSGGISFYFCSPS